MTIVKIDPIKTLLVANRGEIASRVFKTAHEMGINTVAIYADGDACAPFVQDADRAISLDGKTATETYLNINKILTACKESRADAVHPGYGFLSENADFAKAVIDAGVKWIGPPVEAISQMGDKLAAKTLMRKINVPVLEAIEINNETNVHSVAEQLGYPVLIKASAGGGGRGMRIVAEPNQLDSAIESARRESQSFFASDVVFMERWIHPVRHIEFQILGDLYRNVVHLFERECSIQRRHQKVIEEAPSPAVASELRDRRGQAAVTIAKTMHYSSAGTIEFLVSGNDFWFLEVNTRLQVEHPITEEITNTDLVREQIRIAEGHPLEFGQGDLDINGHAIEARLYAEDPVKGFLPSPGTIRRWHPSPTIRFDSGVDSNTIVNVEFDSMIAKAVSHAKNRLHAIANLQEALESTHIQGIQHNRDFLVAILKTAEFREGDTTTDFIERVKPALEREYTTHEVSQLLIACTLFGWYERCQRFERQVPLLSIWKNEYMPRQYLDYEFQSEAFSVSYRSEGSNLFSFIVGGEHYKVELQSVINHTISILIDGAPVSYKIWNDELIWYVHDDQGDSTFHELPRFSEESRELTVGSLAAPMPGRILLTKANEGDQVVKGQLLMILEAMKMEHRIVAPIDGTIKKLAVLKGDQVEKDVVLVEMNAN